MRNRRHSTPLSESLIMSHTNKSISFANQIYATVMHKAEKENCSFSTAVNKILAIALNIPENEALISSRKVRKDSKIVVPKLTDETELYFESRYPLDIYNLRDFPKRTAEVYSQYMMQNYAQLKADGLWDEVVELSNKYATTSGRVGK